MKKFMKIIVGLALEESIRKLEFNPQLNDVYVQLNALYSVPNRGKIRSLHNDLVGSSNANFREIGFWLEPLITVSKPTIDWRDLVIEMQETELQLFNIFYLLEVSRERRHEINDLREWFNSIGSSVNYIRQDDWIHAKIHASKAFEFSLSNSIETMRKDEHLSGAIDAFRKETKKYFEQVKTFPVRIEIPEDRFDAIIEIQEVLVELVKELYLHRPDRVLSDVILYPIEKLGVAMHYLMDPKLTIEGANYELGCACEHFRRKIGNIKDVEKKKWANHLYKRIEFLFSQLPVKPWPMRGFGEPGVESRFED